jgi:membrane-bound serine protease (ClpP class)
MIGRTAEVLVALEPKGTVLVEGERWSAISEADRVEPGEEVIITRVEGLKLYVDKKQ